MSSCFLHDYSNLHPFDFVVCFHSSLDPFIRNPNAVTLTVLLQDLEIRQSSMVIIADAILKSLGDTDEIHSLNRRLELTFSIKPTDNQDS